MDPLLPFSAGLAIWDDTPTLVRFLGRFHVVLVHFPIALIVVAAGFEYVGRASTREARRSAARTLLLLAWLAAAVTATTGWWYAASEPISRSMESDLFWHRWTGIAAGAVAFITWIGALLVGRPRGRQVYRIGLLLGVLLVAAAGHLGGELVHGEGFLTEVLTRDGAAGDGTAASGPGGGATGSGSPAGMAADDPDAVDYHADVVPILAARCYDCHGTAKSKGRLRLHRLAPLFAGPESEWLIRPGDPEGSELLRRVTLPADDLDRMPAEGPPLTEAQIDTLRRWVEQGAPYDDDPPGARAAPSATPAGTPPATLQPADHHPAPDELAAAAAAFREPDLTPVPLPGAVESLLAALRDQGAVATAWAANDTDVAVDFAHAPGEVGAAQLALLDGLQRHLVQLDLSHTAVGDDDLAALSGFTALRRLRLDHTRVGDAGLAHLSGLTALRTLNLVGTAVGDAGLGHLMGLHQLRALYLWRTRCTAEGVAALQVALPEVDIELGEA